MKKGGWSDPVWWASAVGMMAAALAARVPELGPARDDREAHQAAAEAPGREPRGRPRPPERARAPLVVAQYIRIVRG